MIFIAEYSVELKDGRVGIRKGPIHIPDHDLPQLYVEPLFTTSKKDYSKTQCIISGQMLSRTIVDYNIHELQQVQDKLTNKITVKGFRE